MSVILWFVCVALCLRCIPVTFSFLSSLPRWLVKQVKCSSLHPCSINIFRTLRLWDCWADVDEAWHIYMYSIGLGSRVLNFGSCATLRHHELSPVIQARDKNLLNVSSAANLYEAEFWIFVPTPWYFRVSSQQKGWVSQQGLTSTRHTAGHFEVGDEPTVEMWNILCWRFDMLSQKESFRVSVCICYRYIHVVLFCSFSKTWCMLVTLCRSVKGLDLMTRPFQSRQTYMQASSWLKYLVELSAHSKSLYRWVCS